jgi:hypothetical protein
MGRALSDEFMDKLHIGGDYAQIVEEVRKDKDLDMEFRGEYLDVYYKGNRILGLKEGGGLKPLDKNIQKHLDEKLTSPGSWLKKLPQLKAAVTKQHSEGAESIERESEQLIIRANNRESGYNSEYTLVDRQYAYRGSDGNPKKWDLLAVKWPQGTHSSKKPKGYLVLIEVKYALANDIKKIDAQVGEYYLHLRDQFESICKDMEHVLKQKLQLGLISRTEDQRKKLQILTLDRNPELADIVIYLVDYNPNSKLVKNAKEMLRKLDFSAQIRVKRGGFAMWDKDLEPLD